MKKDLNWLKNEVQKIPVKAYGFNILKERDEYMVDKDEVIKLIDQFDEPEVLSWEWIEENSALGQFATSEVINFDKFVKADKLQNLLVPKQPFGNSEELPVIPQFVADFLTGKEDYVLYELFDDEWLYKEYDRVAKWLYDNDKETNKKRELSLILAHYGEYTVEEEPKYIIDLDDEETSDGNHYLKHLEISEDGVNYRVCDPLSALLFESKEEAHLIAEYVGGRVKELEE